jgi:hypothetical protein
VRCGIAESDWELERLEKDVLTKYKIEKTATNNLLESCNFQIERIRRIYMGRIGRPLLTEEETLKETEAAVKAYWDYTARHRLQRETIEQDLLRAFKSIKERRARLQETTKKEQVIRRTFGKR